MSELISSGFGHLVHSMLVEKAVEHGMSTSDDERRMLGAYVAGDTTVDDQDVADAMFDTDTGLVDRAEAWLNQHVAPAGHRYGYFEGSVMLWPEETWAEEVPQD